jgi:hypothetical protein
MTGIMIFQIEKLLARHEIQEAYNQVGRNDALVYFGRGGERLGKEKLHLAVAGNRNLLFARSGLGGIKTIENLDVLESGLREIERERFGWIRHAHAFPRLIAPWFFRPVKTKNQDRKTE